VMCYTVDGKEYTFLAKDELEREMPVLKKYYLTYSEVAGKDVQYIFYDLFKNYIELKAETLSSSYFINDGKGNFTRKDLPNDLQQAPIFSFAQFEDNKNFNNYIAVGNFFGVMPYEGKYDALYPTLFSFDAGKNQFEKNALLPEAKGEMRDAKWLNSINGTKLLVFARNNDSLLFYKLIK